MLINTNIYKVIGYLYETWAEPFNIDPKSVSTPIQLHNSGYISVSGVYLDVVQLSSDPNIFEV